MALFWMVYIVIFGPQYIALKDIGKDRRIINHNKRNQML